MTDKKKSHKILKIIALSLVSIIVTAGALAGLDYKSYKDGNRSVLFGTLDTYNQNQTLKFGNLDLKVTNISLKAYSTPITPTQTTCSHGGDVNGVFVPDSCSIAESAYQQLLNQQRTSNRLTVNYTYSNVSNQPLNMSEYIIKLIANTPLNDSSCDKPSGLLLKGNQLTGCMSDDVPKNYHGVLSLVVTSNNETKTITLSFPKSK